MWEARATYEDGTEVDMMFSSHGTADAEEQYELECWLIEKHEGCTWYSVNWVYVD